MSAIDNKVTNTKEYFDNPDFHGTVQEEMTVYHEVDQQERLLTATAKFEAVFNQCGIFAGITDLDGNLREVNDMAVNWCGYTKEQVLGRPFPETPWWRGSEEVKARIRVATQEAALGNVFRETLSYWLADGTERIVDFAMYPIRDEFGTVIFLHPTGIDITERKHNETAAQRLAAIVESSDDAIVSKDLNGVISSWNKGAERVFGYRADEVIGKPVTILMPPERVNEEPGILERIRNGERIEHYETVRRRKDGTLIDISLTVSPIRNASGRVIGASKVARDITEKVRAKEKLEKTVAERTASLRDAIAQMEEFSYTVSHDLRSPVRAMQGYARVLVEDYGGRLDDEGREYLDRIIQGSSRMERLIHDVLTYSRVSRMDMKLQRISLDAVVRDVVRQYPEFETRRADIFIQANLPDVLGHEPSLGQAIANLLSNAVKFVAPGVRPNVLIMAERNKETVTLRVKDNGIGIKPEYQHRLFAMFERIHPEGKYEGTGIGLAIVRKTAERIGGKVGVESDGINGSVFWIQLLAAPGT